MEKIKEIHNELMKRKELKLKIKADKTPSYAEAAKMIAEHFKTHEDHVMVEKVQGSFGSQEFIIQASIYENKESKEQAFKRLTKAKKTATPAA